MQKRRLAFVLLFVTALTLSCCSSKSYISSNASAEEFALRNDIHFEETKEQVRSKETIAIDEKNSSQTHLWTEHGTVAGFDDVQIVYIFDDEGKLNEVKWTLDEKHTSDLSDSDYAKLENAMREKYGEPLGYNNGDSYVIKGVALENAFFLSIFGGSVRDYDEWDYEYEDGQHVKIELAQFRRGNSYGIYVGYKHFTEAELNLLLQNKDEEHSSVMEDI